VYTLCEYMWYIPLVHYAVVFQHTLHLAQVKFTVDKKDSNEFEVNACFQVSQVIKNI
jgi:hypothetical protein